MKIIDGTNFTLGRLASYAAKLALKGEEVSVVNCQDIIITGNKEHSLKEIRERKSKIGSGQQGPKHSLSAEKITKRAIRGMLPRARIKGRGKDAYSKVKCYIGIPDKLKDAGMEKSKEARKKKFSTIREILK